ncbi:hypothetical protein F4677DRAFT_32152 [Hypoxylon crocopeplum]|nr:hypothetical protein F4677DRAFT_32152 [Hypoxylon crocopeplum]
MASSTWSPSNTVAASARKVYRAVGFSKTYNFWLWFFLVGGLLGFTIRTLPYLDFHGVFCGESTGGEDAALPGECFYYLQPGRYQIGIILHLACILPAGLLACVQFIPIARRKAMWLHRISGWVSVVLAGPGTVGTLMIVRRAMGGGIDTQSMVGLLAIMFTVSLTLGVINARNHRIEQHRAWMLRAWVNAGAIITMRLIIGISVIVLSMAGGYYTVQPCEKVSFILGGEDATLASYPECAPFFSGEDPNRHIAVLANVLDNNKVEVASAINLVFGMCGWVAIFIHVFGVEVYLRLTSTKRNTVSRATGIKQPVPLNSKSEENGTALKKVE